MSSDQSASTSQEFIAVAQREGLLPADSAADLTRESASRSISPAQLALQRGLLTAVQIEIIETLLNPRAVISGYEILGLLGYGGMGIVYRARQLSLGRIVALKTVLLNAKTNPSRLARFEQEAQTVGRLLHPHIVTAYDFGRDGGRVFFAMELVEGEDVERWINREGPLSEATTWGLVRQAAAGLAQAAEFGIVHRDIKPANLLLVTQPKRLPLPPALPLVKIADFGLALIRDEDEERTRLTADNSTVGSPHYMAPEQLTGAEIDHRTDIYALGAAAYHMLSGRPPFDGLTLPQIYAQKLNNEPASLSSLRSGLSLETVTLVEELMAADRDRRISGYVQLMDRIDELLPATRLTPSSRTTATAITLKPLRTVSTETRRVGAETQTQFPEPTFSTLSPASSGFGRRVFELSWRVVVAVLLIASMGYAVSMWQADHKRLVVTPGMELKPSGVAAHLFDGQSLEKWKTLAGNWQTMKDDEGATVIAASGGIIARRLHLDKVDSLQHFRLTFLAALHDATAIELSFGVHATRPDFETRSVLRIEREQVILSQQSADSSQLLPTTPPLAWSLNPQQFHEVRIERQSSEWRVFIDNRLIGTLPLAEKELQNFRLAVYSRNENQFAWFAEFLLEELLPP